MQIYAKNEMEFIVKAIDGDNSNIKMNYTTQFSDKIVVLKDKAFGDE